MTLNINKFLLRHCQRVKESHKGNKKKGALKTFSLAASTVEGIRWCLQCLVKGNGSFQSKGVTFAFSYRFKEHLHDYAQSPKGKLVHAKAKARRCRELGFNPINEPFPGSEAHHINKNDVIYILVELHRSVHHNLSTGKGMEEINDLAQEFLLAELGEC